MLSELHVSILWRITPVHAGYPRQNLNHILIILQLMQLQCRKRSGCIFVLRKLSCFYVFFSVRDKEGHCFTDVDFTDQIAFSLEILFCRYHVYQSEARRHQ